MERLRSHFPSHAIVAEEGGGHESPSEYRWFVDPLDGTTNFAHSFPMFNVTLGLERAGEMIAGVVYDPIRQEMFTAERGAGAYLNNRRIRVSSAGGWTTAWPPPAFPAASGTTMSTSTSTTRWPWRRTACGVPGRRPSTWHTWPAAAWTSSGNSASSPGIWRPATCWCRKPAAASPTCGAVRHSVTASDHLLADNGHVHDEVIQIFGDIFGGQFRVGMPTIA